MTSNHRRVLIIIHGLPVGGAEKMLVNIVNRLEQGRFRATIVSLSKDNPLAETIRPGAARVIALPRHWRYDLTPAREIRRIIRESDIDVVLCFGLYEFFFAHLAVKKLRKSPRIVISIHNTRLASLKKHLQHWMYARFLDGSERFISVCDTQADYWATAYHIPRNRFATVYNGVDVNHFRPSDESGERSAIRAQWGIPVEAFILLLVGL